MPQPNLVMNCPFCARALGREDMVQGGRYSCPSCASTSQEARYGWLPTPRITPQQGQQTRKGLTRAAESYLFAHNADGEAVEREARCSCGRPFTQRLLSPRWLERLNARAFDRVEQQIPSFYVPVHCPACERRDLGLQARRDEMRRGPAASYYEHEEAAD